VIALSAALGLFDIAQQGVHFRERKLTICAHRCVAGHGRQHFVLKFLDALRTAVLDQVGKHVARKLFAIGIFEQRRNCAQA